MYKGSYKEIIQEIMSKGIGIYKKLGEFHLVFLLINMQSNQHQLQ